jgi:hypothetical protein
MISEQAHISALEMTITDRDYRKRTVIVPEERDLPPVVRRNKYPLRVVTDASAPSAGEYNGIEEDQLSQTKCRTHCARFEFMVIDESSRP